MIMRERGENMYLYLPERIYNVLKNDEEYNNFKFVFEKQFERFSGKGLIDSYYLDEIGKNVIDSLGIAGKNLIEALIKEKIPEASNQFKLLFIDCDLPKYLEDNIDVFRKDIESIPNFTLDDIWKVIVSKNNFDVETQINFSYNLLFNYRDFSLNFKELETEYSKFLLNKIISLAEENTSIRFSECIYAYIFYANCMKKMLDWKEEASKEGFEKEFGLLLKDLEDILNDFLKKYKCFGLNYQYLKNNIIYEFHNVIWNLSFLLQYHLTRFAEEEIDYIEKLQELKDKYKTDHTFSFFEFQFIHSSFLHYFYRRNFAKAIVKLNKVVEYISYAFLNPKKAFHELNYHQDNFVPAFLNTCVLYIYLSRIITKMNPIPTSDAYQKSECDLMFLNGFFDKVKEFTGTDLSKRQESEDFVSLNKETFDFFNIFLEKGE